MLTKYRLYLQVIITSFLSIMTIECILMIGAYDSKINELNELQSQYDQVVMTEEVIEQKAIKHLYNIFFLSILISLFVAFVSVVIYHFIAGKHIHNLIWLNESYRKDKSLHVNKYNEKSIPNNEVGKLIRTYQSLINEVYQNEVHLEENLTKAKSELIHSAKVSAIGELIGGILHDIGNPLTVILGKSLLMSKKDYLEKKSLDQIAEGSEKIQFSAQKIEKIVKSVREYSREQVEFSENTSISKMIETSILLTHTNIMKSKVQLINNIPADLPGVYADIGSIEQVMTNLISNACDAVGNRESGSQIIIDAQPFENCINLTIQDNGEGIEQKDLDRIFESYFSTKGDRPGLGMGLSNCARIIEEHGGKISCKSEIGLGTTFTLTLNRFKPIDNASSKEVA